MVNKKYREVVSAIIINKDKKVLMCEHVWIDNAWQFPQGGVEKGENHETAILRELDEELCMKDIKILKNIEKPIKYQFPYYLKEKYGMEGNVQYFYLLYFYGDESTIRFDNQEKPEFKAFKWTEYDVPPQEVIYFKKLSYYEALNIFKDYFDKLDLSKIDIKKK